LGEGESQGQKAEKKITIMDISIAAKAAQNFQWYTRLCEALAALESKKAIAFYCEGITFELPDELRADILRHFRKAKEAVTAEIQNL
jgi:hypothetical protein